MPRYFCCASIACTLLSHYGVSRVMLSTTRLPSSERPVQHSESSCSSCSQTHVRCNTEITARSIKRRQATVTAPVLAPVPQFHDTHTITQRCQAAHSVRRLAQDLARHAGSLEGRYTSTKSMHAAAGHWQMQSCIIGESARLKPESWNRAAS